MSSAPNPLRIVYMGTPDFAVPALEALASSRDFVVGVFTNPDRPSGRGKKLTPPPVKVAAQKLGIPVFQPAKCRGPEVVATLKELTPDVIVVAAYGQILKTDVLDLPPHGCLNIHASLLPKYRGAAPINWAIVRGEEESGVTIMRMDVGLDTGPMILKKKVLIGPLDTAQDLHDTLADVGAELIVDVMRLIHLESLTLIQQNDELATWAPMLSKQEGLIDWTQSARQVADHIRGFNPWPGAYTFLYRDHESGPERIKFHLARPLAPDQLNGLTNHPPGTVVQADATTGSLVIRCGEGFLKALNLQAPGRRAVDTPDFLNGYNIREGHHFAASTK